MENRQYGIEGLAKNYSDKFNQLEQSVAQSYVLFQQANEVRQDSHEKMKKNVELVIQTLAAHCSS